ncbi:MAG: mercuric reductase [Gemmatirosa sp.]
MTTVRSAALHADDPSDRTLLSHVHPSDWTPPTPRDRYHLVVIGAGTGGLVTAAAAAGLGASVALVERGLMGGDCLNVGCVPSKALIRAARAWHEARTAPARFGAEGSAAGPAPTADDFAAALARLRRLRARIAPIDGAPRFRDLGVDVFLGDARFVDRETIVVDGRRLRFRRAVIATGGRAAIPDVPGLADVGCLTNETVFALRARPARLVVLGGGPIGCELAQAFARLGSAVTLVEGGARLLPRDDADAAATVARALERDGVTLLLGARVARASRDASGARVLHLRDADGAERAVAGDELVVAAGRAPTVEGLGLEAAGVRHTKDGVTVDDRLRTSNARVFAVGDVCSPLKFTHAADFQARAVVQNALFFGRVRASRMVVPWATYTSPEVAQVGLTADAARDAGTAVDVVTVPFHEVDRAILDDAEDGFVRVVLAKGTDRILGVTVVAEHAGDLISEATLAMTNGLGLSAMGRTIHPYPTQAEAFRKAADQWRRGKLTPRVQALFRAWFRTVR